MANDELKNETQKAEEKMRKEWSVQEIMGTLTKDQQMLLSYFMHISIQKGRVMGRMEMDGKSVEEIANAVKAPLDAVQKALEEDPFEVIAK